MRRFGPFTTLSLALWCIHDGKHLIVCARGADFFDTGQLQSFYDNQGQALKQFRQNPERARGFTIALDVHGRGFSDWSWFICAHLTTLLPIFPKNTLFFSNHSALDYLRAELDFLDWRRHSHFFSDFAQSQLVDDDDELVYLQFPAVTYFGDDDVDINCDPAIWRDLIQPSARVTAKVEQYVRPEQYALVGLHIRSYWLLEHDVKFNNRYGIRAQDFLDCALSLHRHAAFNDVVNTCSPQSQTQSSDGTCPLAGRPVRYFVASDSSAITAEWLSKVPYAIAHAGSVAHTGSEESEDLGEGQRNDAERDEALLKVFVDYFVLTRADFVIQTHGSSWHHATSYRMVPTLDLEKRPSWCDALSDTYTMHTFDADIK